MDYYELSGEAINQLSTISQLEMKSINDTVLMLASEYFGRDWEKILQMDIFDDVGAN